MAVSHGGEGKEVREEELSLPPGPGEVNSQLQPHMGFCLSLSSCLAPAQWDYRSTVQLRKLSSQRLCFQSASAPLPEPGKLRRIRVGAQSLGILPGTQKSALQSEAGWRMTGAGSRLAGLLQPPWEELGAAGVCV